MPTTLPQPQPKLPDKLGRILVFVVAIVLASLVVEMLDPAPVDVEAALSVVAAP